MSTLSIALRAQQMPLYRVDIQFVAMLDSYRDSGGLARAEEVITLFEQHGGPDVATLARWIVEREVISFEWQEQTWLPLFQFARPTFTPLAGVAAVSEALGSVYDRWELSRWFTRPNASLGNRRPVDAIAASAADVLEAARADRFVVTG